MEENATKKNIIEIIVKVNGETKVQTQKEFNDVNAEKIVSVFKMIEGI